MNAPENGTLPATPATRKTVEKIITTKLTKRLCSSTAAGAYERVELRDTVTTGLSLRISGANERRPDGSRVWHLAYRIKEPASEAEGGKAKWVGRRMKLGDFPGLSLDDARERAGEHKRVTKEGRDPQMVLAAEAARFKAEQDALANRATVKAVLEEYLKEGMKNDTAAHVADYTSKFERYVYPKIGNEYVSDIQAEDISRLVSGIIEPDGKNGVAANRLLTAVKAAFNWTCAHRSKTSGLTVNPADKLKKPFEEVSDSRALTDDELPLIWKAAGRQGYPAGQALQLMLLTGQRRGDVSNMRFSHLDLDKGKWTQPAWIDRALGKGGNKARRQHFLSLPPKAVEILKRLQDDMADQDYRKAGDDHVFIEKNSEPPGAPLKNSWHKAQPELRKLANEIAGKELDHWEVEFSRHTVRTALSAKPISATEIVGELILNHAVTGKLQKVYNQHDFIEEMGEALAKWEKKLLAIVEPAEREVVKFPQRAGRRMTTPKR